MSVNKSRLNIAEEDGSPSTFPYKLKVTNGTLTDNGDGTASLAIGGGSGASTALDNLASVAINTSLITDTDSTDDLGSSSKYWANLYIDRIYLNATAYLDGASAGVIGVVQASGRTFSPYFKPSASSEFLGSTAGNTTTTANNNFAIGPNALDAITSGVSNVAIGGNALGAETTGGYSIAIGENALANHNGSSNHANTAIGRNALINCTGGENMAFGAGAGSGVSSGNYNALIGNNAGSTITTGSDNICIGGGANVAANNNTNSISIGRSVVGNGSNTVTIGNSSNTAYFFTGKLATLSNANLSLVPNGTGYTIIGDAGTTSHSFNTNDDLLVSGRLEVDGILYADSTVDTSDVYKVDGVQVVSNRVIDARADDVANSGDATTDGLIDALRDAMITHGLIAAA